MHGNCIVNFGLGVMELKTVFLLITTSTLLSSCVESVMDDPNYVSSHVLEEMVLALKFSQQLKTV